jgi:hypothetical protein
MPARFEGDLQQGGGGVGRTNLPEQFNRLDAAVLLFRVFVGGHRGDEPGERGRVAGPGGEVGVAGLGQRRRQLRDQLAERAALEGVVDAFEEELARRVVGGAAKQRDQRFLVVHPGH